MQKSRPVNLNLFTIKLPVTALASILHRVSGVLVFLAIPVVLLALDMSLRSPEGFNTLTHFLGMPLIKCVVWGLATAFAYHFWAGIRHLLMDFHWLETMQGGRCSAYTVFLLTAITAILIGVYLW